MNKNILSITILALGVAISSPANAQLGGLLNKLKKKDKSEKTEITADSKSSREFVNIADYANKWESGEYDQFEMDGFLVVPTGKVKVEFIKGSDGSVKEIKVGDETYKKDVKSNSPMVVSYYKKGGRKLYFNETGIIQYYLWKGTGGYEEFSVQRFIGVKQKTKGVAKEIKAYRAFAEEKAEKDAEIYAANAKAESEKNEAERKNMDYLTKRLLKLNSLM